MKPILFLLLLSCFSVQAQNIKQSLNSDKMQWKFYCTTNCEFGKAGQKFSATVPGTIHLDLLDNKLIPDPFYADNEKRLQWIDTLDWVYETTFDVDSNLFKQNNIELQFDGLDTYADVYLNDEKIITADNMFVKWNEQVKEHLKQKNNQLKIIFHSTLKEAKKLKAKFEKEHGYELPEGERVFVRKAQYQFGWDFAPKFLGCGIWRNVKLMGIMELKIENVKLEIDSFNKQNDFAYTHVIISYENLKQEIFTGEDFNATDVWLKFKNLTTKQELHFVNRNHFTSSGSFSFPLKFIKKDFWNCNSEGSPILNEFKISISNDSIHYITQKIKIGIRKVDFIQQKDSIGESFYFKLNGKPIFIKGANWVPADVFLPRVSHQKYRTLLTAAKEAGMNMLRVWGGGVYEDEYFYHLCDSLGIMVWQDLMFACALYPEDSLVTSNSVTGKIAGYRLFPANAEDELEQIKSRLQNHPSVVLFCGNNEIEEGLKNWGWQESLHYTKKDSAIESEKYFKMFSDKTQGLKGDIFYEDDNYISTSPKFGWGHKESLTNGDSHYWGVWWGMEPYEIYKKRVPRFASEYGMQSLPCLATIRKFAPDSSLRINSVALRNHQKHPTGFENLDGYLKYYGFKVNGGLVKGRKVIPEYGIGNPDEADSTWSTKNYHNPTIKEFEDYINATQHLQADALKTAIEAHMKTQPRCMGTILWQLNEPWPGASWSLIDYYGNKKKAYYQVQKLFTEKKQN